MTGTQLFFLVCLLGAVVSVPVITTSSAEGGDPLPSPETKRSVFDDGRYIQGSRSLTLTDGRKAGTFVWGTPEDWALKKIATMKWTFEEGDYTALLKIPATILKQSLITKA